MDLSLSSSQNKMTTITSSKHQPVMLWVEGLAATSIVDTEKQLVVQAAWRTLDHQLCTVV